MKTYYVGNSVYNVHKSQSIEIVKILFYSNMLDKLYVRSVWHGYYTFVLLLWITEI